jgi:hypothetical protein
MTKRLQVLMDDDELRSIQRLARDERVTTAEWVRQRLREAQELRARPDIERKLAVVRSAARFRAPAPDIDQMNAEIEQGYLEERSTP